MEGSILVDVVSWFMVVYITYKLIPLRLLTFQGLFDEINLRKKRYSFHVTLIILLIKLNIVEFEYYRNKSRSA